MKKAWHVYSDNGFESGHRTERAALAAARRYSAPSKKLGRLRGSKVCVVETGPAGYTGGGQGTQIACFRNGRRD